MRALLVYYGRDGNVVTTQEFPSQKARNVSFWYDSIEIIAVVESSLDLIYLCWGVDNKDIPLAKQSTNSGRQYCKKASEFLDTKRATAAPHYESERLSSRAFISNLLHGQFELSIREDDHYHELGRINRNNIIGLEGNTYQYYENIVRYVYGSERSIIFDEIFHNRSNIYLSTRPGSPPVNFTTVIDFARRTLTFMEKIRRTDLKLPSVLQESRDWVTYSEELRVDDASLRNIVSGNVTWEMRPGSTNTLFRNKIPRILNIPVTESSFDVDENYLLIDLANQLCNLLSFFVDELEVSVPFIESTIQKLRHSIEYLCNEFGLNEHGKHSQEIPYRFLNSPSHELQSIGQTIQAWKTFGSEDPNLDTHTHRFSVHTTDKLWEFFCLEKIISVAKSLGLYDIEIKESAVELKGEHGFVNLYYDTEIPKGGKFFGIVNCDVRGKRPDFLVFSNIKGVSRIGVLDPKFTPDESQWRGRGSEIWEKYGLWLRNEDRNVIDYVYSIVPSITEGSRISELSKEQVENLDFGTITLRMSNEDTQGNEAILQLFT